MSYRTEEIFGNAIMVVVCSAIGGVILLVVYGVFLFPFFHDCGRWICDHGVDFNWTNFLICFGICAVFLSICLACAESDKGSPRPTTKRYQNRRTTHYSSGRETDYYDSDMEGAPGYYGFD